MIKVVERGGVARVFNIKDAKDSTKPATLRLLARKSKLIEDNQVSDELKLAEKMGIIALIPVASATPSTAKAKTKKAEVSE